MAEKMTPEQMEQKRMELMERQIALQEKQAAALETQVERTAPKENPNYVEKGPFSDPTGAPWAKSLTIEVYDGPIKLNDTNLTQLEVEQLNRLAPIEKGHIVKADRSTVQASVLPTYDAQNRLSRLMIRRPMGRDDNAQQFPPLDEMAKQLADQAMALV